MEDGLLLVMLPLAVRRFVKKCSDVVNYYLLLLLLLQDHHLFWPEIRDFYRSLDPLIDCDPKNIKTMGRNDGKRVQSEALKTSY